MLKARCSSSGGVTEYTQHFVDFSWYVKVNESATLFASIPTVIAMLKIATVDNTLRKLKKNDKVVVTNDTNTALSLQLRVIEVSILERKKEVEISCAYMSFGELYEGVEGVIEIGQNKVGLYALDKVKPWSGALQNDAFLANIRSKDDLILALSWSYSSRRNIALTPFSTAVSNWNSAYERIAIFPDQRHDGSEDGTVPIYVVEPEDIIDYEITSADPPVTHLKTSALGELAPMPQIPARETWTLAGALSQNVRGFFSRDLGLGFLYTAQFKKDSPSVLQYQRLEWTDGIVVEDSTSTRVNVQGFFSNAYLTSAGGLLKVIDRITGAVLASFNYEVVYNASGNLSGLFVGKTTVLETDDAFVELAWLTSLTVDYANVPIAVAKVYVKATQTTIYDLLTIDRADYYHYIVSHSPSSCLSVLDSDQREQSSAVFGVVSNASGELLLLTVDLSGTTLSVSVGGASLDLTAYVDINIVVSLSLAEGRSFDNGFREAEVLLSLVQIYTTAPYGVYDKPIVRLVFDHGSVDSMTEIAKGDLAAFLDPGYLIVNVDADSWMWVDSNNFDYLQRGKLSDWTGIQDMTALSFGLVNGMLMSIVFKETLNVGTGVKSYDVNMQVSKLPFLSRNFVQQYQKDQIAEGQENVVDISFMVGAIDPSKVYIDKEVGRIEVSLSKFYVFDITEQDYIEKDIQKLENMATGAYVEIGLTPDDPSDFVIAKVIGFKLTYSGVVEAKLYGIIVE